MSSLKKRSLLILLAMILLIAIPMSFAADVDAVDDLAIDDDADLDVVADADVDEELEATPIPDNGAFAYMGTDSATIDEGDSFTISGQIGASMGMGMMSKSEMEQMGMTKNGITVTCSYEDNDGNPQEYSTTTSNYDFSFNGATFAGLAGRSTPYLMTIRITDDGTINYDGSGIKTATFTLNVNEPPAPAVGDATYIQGLIDAAEAGGTIDLSAYPVYDVENTTFEVTKANLIFQGTGSTIIKGWGGPGNGIFHVANAGSGVTFRGIRFEDTNPDSILTYYDNETKDAFEVKGWGIHFQGAKNCIVDNCSFINFNHGVRIQQQANDVTVKNSYFTGVTNYLRNDPQVNVEKGTKAIGIMGSQRAQLINNTFEGPVLDAISIASGSGGCYIFNNTFIGNSYSIYFGGASTDATVIKGNKFRNVGEFHGTDAKTGNAVDWTLLPIISIEKSSTGIEIIDNEIQALNNNIIIAAEAGNTAHGGLSALGNITVTGNVITPYDSSVDVASVTLLHILSRTGDFNPNGDVNVSNNVLNGATPIFYWNTAWGDENGNAVIPAGDLAVAFIVFDSIGNDSITATLLDGDGVAVENAVICYAINGVDTGNFTLDDTGEFTIYGQPGDVISISYDGKTFTITKDKKGNLVTTWIQTFKPISLNITIPNTTPAPTPEPTPTPTPEPVVVKPVATTLTACNLAIKAGNAGTIKATLKDANGKVLANQNVVIQIDGKVLAKGKTNAKGVFSASVKYASAATKYAYISFVDSTGKYSTALKTIKITVSKKATTLTAKKATLKVKKAKKIQVTLKSEGKAVAGKKVTIKVNKKTFSAKTNSKGVATIKVKITKKGSHKATVSFAGDGAYKTVSKTVTFKVKK